MKRTDDAIVILDNVDSNIFKYGVVYESMRHDSKSVIGSHLIENAMRIALRWQISADLETNTYLEIKLEV